MPWGASDPDGAQAIRFQFVGGQEHDPAHASPQRGLPGDGDDQFDPVALR
jgi:hypothetical protein